MSKKIKCEACNKYDATNKDYRFIDQLSFQGSCYLCEWCFPLNDVTLYQISNEKLDQNMLLRRKDNGNNNNTRA